MQVELIKRKNAGCTNQGSCFSSKIVCCECCAFYGPKVWHSTSKYKRTIWQCNRKFKNGKHCSTPHFNEDQIKAAFVAVVNRMIEDREVILDDNNVIIDQLTDMSVLDAEEHRLTDEDEIVLAMINRAVVENASKSLDQAEYNLRYAELTSKYRMIDDKIKAISNNRNDRNNRRIELDRILHALKRSTVANDFDDRLWGIIVSNITILYANALIVNFRSGTSFCGDF